MKTVIGTLLALGLLSTAASAQYCPPGFGYGPRVGIHQPTQSVPAPVAVAPVEAPAAPIEPAPAQPAPEAPPK